MIHLAIFNYLYTLSDYNELIEVAENEGKISSEDIQTLVEWRDNLA